MLTPRFTLSSPQQVQVQLQDQLQVLADFCLSHPVTDEVYYQLSNINLTSVRQPQSQKFQFIFLCQQIIRVPSNLLKISLLYQNPQTFQVPFQQQAVVNLRQVANNLPLDLNLQDQLKVSLVPQASGQVEFLLKQMKVEF